MSSTKWYFLSYCQQSTDMNCYERRYFLVFINWYAVKYIDQGKIHLTPKWLERVTRKINMIWSFHYKFWLYRFETHINRNTFPWYVRSSFVLVLDRGISMFKTSVSQCCKKTEWRNPSSHSIKKSRVSLMHCKTLQPCKIERIPFTMRKLYQQSAKDLRYYNPYQV